MKIVAGDGKNEILGGPAEGGRERSCGGGSWEGGVLRRAVLGGAVLGRGCPGVGGPAEGGPGKGGLGEGMSWGGGVLGSCGREGRGEEREGSGQSQHWPNTEIRPKH